MFILDDEFDVEFQYFGLTTKPITSYKFAYLLNKHLNFRFKRESDVQLTENNTVKNFTCFTHIGDSKEVICSLVNNAIANKFDTQLGIINLLPSYPNIHWILGINNEFTSFEINKLTFHQFNFIDSVIELNNLKPFELERIRTN